MSPDPKKKPVSTSASLPARSAALRLMRAVIEDQKMLSEVSSAPWIERLIPADRARAMRLATEALRHADRSDRLLKPLLRKDPPDAVKAILWLGVYEICALDTAAHGVVNDMVTLTSKDRHVAGYKGMVNAVLRRATEAGVGKWGKMPVPRLPKWLRQPMIAAYGNPGVMAIEAAHMRGAPLDLTPKPGAASMPDGTELPTGSIRLSGSPQVTALPGFAEGDWWVQDAAAALPVQLLAPQKGERIADLCAAPGGKTMQLAAVGAKVTAVDDSETRLERVRENLTRTGLTAEIVCADVMTFQAEPFDAIVLDAPCSATGTLRRHPDLPFAKQGEGISELIALQSQMIDAALAMLKPGGRMVFCTCSLIPDEGEVQVDEALLRHSDVTVDRAALDRPGIDPSWVTEEGGLRLRPDYWSDVGGMDGFYMAVLRKGA
ncbi:RsmB/NOP family class I SAM-dependent RNA methyltransferase [Shimia ponticola]|uniref:RsmB/NOP family class I SAM-dependent RNA methyltransferase n=1 Tax=Shimia ponticola TaxID=2582893 RepID=UPI0011BFB09D|nr:transcription antitermination factor NusB [Shimia ponticola]